MRIIPFIGLLSIVASQPVEYSTEDLKHWEDFKQEHKKIYLSDDEEDKRKNIFFNNLKFVNEHNEKYRNNQVSFEVEINSFADLSVEEFNANKKGLRLPKGPRLGGELFNSSHWDTTALPDEKDWRDDGAVTPVKDQQHCGSCWAFSATGCLEGQIYLKTRELVSLSEQNLIDCSRKYGNYGCMGGDPAQAFEYVKDNRGIDTEDSYPYMGRDGSCNYNVYTKGAEDYGYVTIHEGDEYKLQMAVANVGPISVGIDASSNAFQFYKSGVLDISNCSSVELHHAVLIVGYGTEDGKDYWLVKNSYGPEWGNKGYIKMSRNKDNQCGIASQASYPKV